MGLMADLGRGPVGVDTVVFIYFIKEDPQFVPLSNRFSEKSMAVAGSWLRRRLPCWRSWLFLNRSGDHLLAERYEALLTQSRGVRVAEISRDHLRAAAQLRAVTAVKTRDSLQLVAALAAGCATFLTNDRELPNIPGLRILQLSSYVK
jgi:predicted nucleic acid-binding protein